MKHLEEVIINYDKKLMEANKKIERLENIIKEVSKELKEFNEEYLEDEGDTDVYRYLNKLIEKLNEGEYMKDKEYEYMQEYLIQKGEDKE